MGGGRFRLLRSACARRLKADNSGSIGKAGASDFALNESFTMAWACIISSREGLLSSVLQ